MKRIFLLGLVLFLIVGCLNSDINDKEIGIYTVNNIYNYEDLFGIKVDNVLQFHTIYNFNCNKIEKWINDGYGVIVTLEFTNLTPKDILSKKYDDKIKEINTCFKKQSGKIYFRPLHEFNGDWYSWSALYQGNTISEFKEAWIHIHNLIDANVIYQLNYNRYNGNFSKIPFKNLYPGDKYVDMITITTYNRCGTDKFHKEYKYFKDDFDSAYWQIKNMTNKPIGIAEMSTSTLCEGNKSRWIINSFTTLKEDYPDIKFITWFLYNRKINNQTWDWDLNTGEDFKAFKQGVEIWH